MAGTTLSQSMPCRELDQHLEDAYNMPTRQWWESAQRAFLRLQELFHPEPAALLSPELDEPAAEYATSARLARAASLPSIILLPSENHALELTATNEPLQCVAIGTVGSKLFVELLWELIAQAQEASGVKIVVHEVLQGPVLLITLSVEAHLFELKYFQCESLVRT
jgi:hypothetical protein